MSILKNFRTVPIGIKILVLWIAVTPLFALAVILLDENFQSPTGIGFSVLISICALLIAWGLILKKNWVRILVIVCAVINLVFGVLYLFLLKLIFNLEVFILLFSLPIILNIVISVLIVWYLQKSSVRVLFQHSRQEQAGSIATIEGTSYSGEQQNKGTKYFRDPRDKQIAFFFLIVPISIFVIDGVFRVTERIGYWIFSSQSVTEWYYSTGGAVRLFLNVAPLLVRGLFLFAVIVSILLAILIFNRKKLREDIPYDERSGKGWASEVPQDIGRWNWGAAGLGFIWGTYHRVWISLIGIIPIISNVWWIVMGLKGNAWAWKMNRWESVDEFKKSQRGAWRVFGIIFILLRILNTCIEIFFIFLLVIVFVRDPSDVRDYRDTIFSEVGSQIDNTEERQDYETAKNKDDQNRNQDEKSEVIEGRVRPRLQQPLPLKKNGERSLKKVFKKESIRFEGIDADTLQEVGYGYYTDFHNTWFAEGDKGVRLQGIDKPFLRCFSSLLCATDSSIWLKKSQSGDDIVFNEFSFIDVASAKRLIGSQLYTDREGVWYIDSVYNFIQRATEIDTSVLRVFADGSADSYDFGIFRDKNSVWTYLEGKEQRLTEITDIDAQSFKRLFPKSDVFYIDKNNVYSFIYGKRDLSGNYIEGDYSFHQISGIDSKTVTLVKEPTDPYPRLKDKNNLYVFDREIFEYQPLK